MNHPITIRRSTPSDRDAVARLAALDSGHAPAPARRRLGLGRLPVPRAGTT